MKRLLIAVTAIGATAICNLLLLGCSQPQEWTTSSPEALREFELGLEARMKYYNNDALDHFAAAVELDEGFVAAKLYLANYEDDWERREALQEELSGQETSGLKPRERFLLEYNIAQWGRDLAAAREIAERYTNEYPEDPYGLATLAELLWENQEWDQAERTYREILEIAPNWVTAQNRLGYIAVAQGRFEEAEDLFETYNYIAPDQANPHDSMGELLILLGRFDEAEAEFERALELRPDFCSTHQHLVELVLMRGDPAAADTILDRASEYSDHCGERMISQLRCSADIWDDFLSGDYENVWTDEREECRRVLGDFDFLVHRTAAMTGRLKIAEKAERGLKMRIEAAEKANHMRLQLPRALLHHMEGTRLMAQKEYEAAAAAFEEADDMLLYWGQGQGILKLYNQVNLAQAQNELGLEEEADRTFARVEAVNPAFAGYFRHHGDSR